LIGDGQKIYGSIFRVVVNDIAEVSRKEIEKKTVPYEHMIWTQQNITIHFLFTVYE